MGSTRLGIFGLVGGVGGVGVEGRKEGRKERGRRVKKVTLIRSHQHFGRLFRRPYFGAVMYGSTHHSN
jgi:hypothetical protein